MFKVIFYEDNSGKSELWNQLEELREKSKNNKDARVQYKQIGLCIQLLQTKGNRLPENICKHLEDGIWELRPGNNRVLYFLYKDNEYVLLHMFRKKTRRTPRRELDKAKRERKNYISRMETNRNENMG